MADPAWPFGCPVKWTQKPRTATIRSEVEAGAPKKRARFTKSYLEITTGWTFESWSMVEQFETFFRIDLNDGALPFTLTNPLTGKAMRVRFKEEPSITGDANSKPTASIEAALEEMLT